MSLKIFQRTKFRAYACLGANQKSKRKYRRCKGRHNKTRQNRKGRPPRVQIGYKQKIETSGLLNGKTPINVYNIEDIKKMNKNNIAIIGSIGDKKRYEIAKEALSKNIEIHNLNLKKFIKKMERKMKHKKEAKNKIKTEGKSKESKK